MYNLIIRLPDHVEIEILAPCKYLPILQFTLLPTEYSDHCRMLSKVFGWKHVIHLIFKDVLVVTIYSLRSIEHHWVVKKNQIKNTITPLLCLQLRVCMWVCVHYYLILTAYAYVHNYIVYIIMQQHPFKYVGLIWVTWFSPSFPQTVNHINIWNIILKLLKYPKNSLNLDRSFIFVS